MTDHWPLTGRGEELRLICEALADDEQRGIIVAGEAGVGKTRLARDAVTVANGPWTVHRIAGTVSGQQVSLGAFARWAGDAETGPAALVRAVITSLTADGKPLLLQVDDAHLLDDLSAMVVHQLVLQDSARVVATVRTGAPAPDAITTLWKDRVLRRLELQPLSRGETAALIESALDAPLHSKAAVRMWKLTQGNVLFLRHLLDQEIGSGRLTADDGLWTWSGTAGVSPSLTELVELQIGAVPTEVRDVVDLVAIAEPVDRARLATLAKASAIEAAEERGLITTSAGGTVQVGHPLYGEIRLSRCGPSRARRLRGSLAAAMATDPGTDALALGLLWLDSDLAPDPGVLARAAVAARARMDLAAAERLARAAVGTADDPAAKLLLASVLLLREDGAGVEEVLRTLRPEQMSIPDFYNGANLRANNLLFTLRDREKSWAVVQEALRGDPPEADQMRTFAAVWLATGAMPAEVLTTTAVVDYARLDSFSTVLGYSAETIALGDLGRPKQADERAAAAYAVLAASPQESFQGSGVTEFHAYAMLAAGQIAEALLIAAHHHLEHSDQPGPAAAMATGALGMTALAAGDLATADTHLGETRARLGDYGEIIGLPYRFHIMHAETLARRGQVEAAAAALAIAQHSRHPAYVYIESWFLLAQAWTAATGGLITQARELSLTAAAFARDHGQWAREVLALQVATQLGRHGCADRLAELSLLVEGPRAPLVTRFARALSDGDAAELEAVSREFEEMGDRLAAADAAAHATACHRDSGRRGSALTASARARRLAQDCGGAVSPALAAARMTIPFTGREREVARLVARDLSNREIAVSMSLSVRTVEGYIYQACSKAGVRNRAELADLIRQLES